MPQIATIVSYLFVIIAYSIKVIHIARMPVHLRWELYPVSHEKGYKHGGSYFEETDWWKKPRQKSTWRDVSDMVRKYLLFPSYFLRNRGYWLALYPWHIGFYLIVGFHVLTFFTALAMVTAGLVVATGSAGLAGRTLYYLAIVVGAAGFSLGSLGSVAMLLKRLTDRDLKSYASPMNYFNYVFFLVVFASGLVSWIAGDPTLSLYREFWVGLITLTSTHIDAATYAHIMLFSAFLIYLPFTRSTHYIMKLIAFFGVRWDDAPNTRGSATEKKVKEALGYPVTWSAPHIPPGKTWRELASEVPEGKTGKNP